MIENIPLVDLQSNYLSLKQSIDKAIAEVINQNAFIGGSGNKYVQKFESDFGNYLDIKNVVSCANGTDAIEIALQSLGVGIGDEVIVPALTWISTAESVVNIGATPVFVDINESDYTINTSLIEDKITKNTKAIIAVHLYGSPAKIDDISAICKRNNLYFIEDCAQAHGAEFNHKKVGTFGDMATFSFYPGKNLGAFGDAGAIVCNDENLAEISRQISNHGQKNKHNHLRIGRNSRMDGIQAAVLSVKLKSLDNWNLLRIEHAKHYNYLIDNKYKKPKIDELNKSVFHLYVIKTKNRAEVITELEKNNISFGIHYPTPLSEMKIFKHFSNCPIAIDVCNSIISLPMFPELKKSQIEYISSVLNNFNNN